MIVSYDSEAEAEMLSVTALLPIKEKAYCLSSLEALCTIT